MASRAPPIPPAQRSTPGEKPHIQGGGANAGQHGASSANLKDQGRHGGIHQAPRHQDR